MASELYTFSGESIKILTIELDKLYELISNSKLSEDTRKWAQAEIHQINSCLMAPFRPTSFIGPAGSTIHYTP